MTTASKLLPAAAGLLLLTTACSDPARGPGTTSTAADPSPATAGKAAGPSTVLFLGDSVAVGEALPLRAAFATSAVGFRSLAADGGGNVVGPFSDKNWTALPGQIAAARPAVVVYQITTYDWGTASVQLAAYRRLLGTVTDAGARLVFVTMPPIRADDFYRPHLADLARAPGIARAVVSGSGGRAALFDASAVWGSTYQRSRNGRPDRSADGIHTCPQGAARFAAWLLGRLADLLPGFTPSPPQVWANTGWSADRHFQGC